MKRKYCLSKTTLIILTKYIFRYGTYYQYHAEPNGYMC